MLAIALALGSSILWGAADFFGGAAARRLPLLAVTLISGCAGLGGLLVAVALRGRGVDPISLPTALIGGACGAIGIACLYRALALGTMSIVSPLVACGAVVPLLLSIIGGERPSLPSLAGGVVALVGAVLASTQERASGNRGGRQAIVLAVAAALAIGSFLYLLGRAAKQGDALSALLGARIGSIALLGVAAGAARTPVLTARSNLPAVVAIGLLDASANVMFVLASNRGLLAIVSVLASLYPVTTVVLAHVFLGERLTAVQRTGLVLALVGIALVSSA